LKKKMTFYINNMAYTINVEEELEPEISKFLSLEQHINTQDLLLATYDERKSFTTLKKILKKSPTNYPKFDEKSVFTS